MAEFDLAKRAESQSARAAFFFAVAGAGPVHRPHTPTNIMNWHDAACFAFVAPAAGGPDALAYTSLREAMLFGAWLGKHRPHPQALTAREINMPPQEDKLPALDKRGSRPLIMTIIIIQTAGSVCGLQPVRASAERRAGGHGAAV